MSRGRTCRMHLRLAGLTFSVGLALFCGCSEPPPTQADAISDIEVRQDTPEATTRSLVRLVRATLDATDAGDRPAIAACHGRIASELIARNDVLPRYEQVAGRLARDPEKVLVELAKNWVSILSYYANDLSLDTLDVERGDSPRKAVIYVRGSRDGREATAVLACVLNDAEKWQIAAIEYLPEEESARSSTATVPATQRTTGD